MVGVLTIGAIALSVNTDKAAPVASGHHPAPNGPGNPYGAPEYGFGGYTSARLTIEIGAQWRVPRLSPHSSEGSATTWIAVQNSLRQFIQLGTFELMNNGVSQYQIFWSDVTVNFHPQNLLRVDAATRSPSRWSSPHAGSMSSTTTPTTNPRRSRSRTRAVRTSRPRSGSRRTRPSTVSRRTSPIPPSRRRPSRT